MWHPLTFVAESRFLDKEKFIAFAKQPGNAAKYRLVHAGQGLEVGTWHVDQMVEDFKASIGEDNYIADRSAEVQRSRAQAAV